MGQGPNIFFIFSHSGQITRIRRLLEMASWPEKEKADARKFVAERTGNSNILQRRFRGETVAGCTGRNSWRFSWETTQNGSITIPRCPRTAQDAAKTPQDAPQDATKAPPNRPPDPRGLQEGHRSPWDSHNPRMLVGKMIIFSLCAFLVATSSKRSRRGMVAGCAGRRLQHSSNAPQNGPRLRQDASRRPQDTPKAPASNPPRK